MSQPRTIGFFLVPQFSMIAFTSAVEPLRLANRAVGRPLYAWRLYSEDGEPVSASNGVEVKVGAGQADARDLDIALVCAGLDVQHQDHRSLMATLRRLLSFGSSIGAVCTGTYVLAKAGLLTGYRSTIHWENYSGLVSEFPELAVSQELFEIDRRRMTCAGGTAALDMMLSVIIDDHGPTIASQVTDQLIHHRIRDANEWQRMALRTRLNVAHPKLLALIARMESAIEAPVSCKQLASDAGLSTRQLTRLFLKNFNVTPSRYYQTLRLEQARLLLRQTSMPVTSAALACGFVSASHFSKSYSEHFGMPPSAERRKGPPL